MFTRRTFLTYSAAGTLTLMAVNADGSAVALADDLPGGSLPPERIPKFALPLVVPPVMPRSRRIGGQTYTAGGRRRGPIDAYAISVRQFSQRMLPSPLPTTTVWGFGPAGGGRGMHHAPSMTIEAEYGVPVRVTWINDLVDDRGRYLKHLLPVDPTLHWANPEQRPDEQGRRTTDIKPSFAGKTFVPPERFSDPATQYTTYQGPVPWVSHLHGATAVSDASDGYSEAWYLPAATNIPAGYARYGRWWPFLAAKAKREIGATWTPGRVTVEYPNLNRACAMWFHDHTLGMTRLNVYAGPVGFYLLRGGPAGADSVTDRRTGRPAILPGHGSSEQRGRTHGQEIPLAVQDRSFNADGSLFYPDTREFFDEYAGPYVPHSPVPPVWNPEFFGNTLIVNGRVWPRLDVEARRYRFRLLNGCGSRFLILSFADIPGVKVHQIGNDGGLLPQVHDVMAEDGRIVLGPAERADVVVDFTDVPLGRHILRNLGPDEPYGGGEPHTDFGPADEDGTGTVMAFDVVRRRGLDRTTPGADLVLPAVTPLPETTRVRRVALMEHAHDPSGADAPYAAMLGVVHGDPATGAAMAHAKMWSDPVTENPGVGDTEIWEIYNCTVDAHPVHLHEVSFEVVNRSPIHVADDRIRLADGPTTPPRPSERGRKDTVVAEPEQVTRIKATFTKAGQYMWHCHVLEHEDNEMMRPIRVGPVQPGQPAESPASHHH